MSEIPFSTTTADERLVDHGQPTRQQMVEEMEAAGAWFEFRRDQELHYLTVHYVGTVMVYQALGDYPVARAYRDFQALQELVSDGVSIICDRTSSQAFRVRVRQWAPRGEGHARQFLYNEHTTSTSCFPVRRAAEKYLAWKAKQS